LLVIGLRARVALVPGLGIPELDAAPDAREHDLVPDAGALAQRGGQQQPAAAVDRAGLGAAVEVALDLARARLTQRAALDRLARGREAGGRVQEQALVEAGRDHALVGRAQLAQRLHDLARDRDAALPVDRVGEATREEVHRRPAAPAIWPSYVVPLYPTSWSFH